MSEWKIDLDLDLQIYSPVPIFIPPSVHRDEGRGEDGEGAIYLCTGFSPNLSAQESNDQPEIIKYPVHVLKTERSVAI